LPVHLPLKAAVSVVSIRTGDHQDDGSEPDLRVDDGFGGTILTGDHLEPEGTELSQRCRRVPVAQVGEERGGGHDRHRAFRSARSARRRVRQRPLQAPTNRGPALVHLVRLPVSTQRSRARWSSSVKISPVPDPSGLIRPARACSCRASGSSGASGTVVRIASRRGRVEGSVRWAPRPRSSGDRAPLS
jgi:hypothetical protein